MKIDATTNQYDHFKSDQAKLAEKIIAEGLPKKIMEFDALLKDPRFSLQRIPEILEQSESVIRYDVNRNETNGCKSKEPGDETASLSENSEGIIKSNGLLMELNVIVRKLIGEMVEELKEVQFFIVCSIPTMEAGNNFGVDVQTEALKALNGVIDKANEAFHTFSGYCSYRSRLGAKCVKYPQLEDARLAVVERDERWLSDLRFQLLNMRNKGAMLHNTLSKNMEKIKHPRTARVDSMY